MHQWGGLTARYNINRAQRFELSAGARRTGFTWQHVTRVMAAQEVVSRELDEAAGGRPIYLGEMRAAFVHDTAVFGPTSPVLGERLRLEIEPALGGVAFTDVRVDARRYFMPLRPVTIAARIEHVGRYGPDAGDSRLTPLVIGLQTLVRGYDLRRFAMDECGRTATECSLLNELTGSRFALFNLEVRAPLKGLLTGDLTYGALPIEAIAFVDAGFLWTRHTGSPLERDRFRSIGAGARANIGGLIVEMTGSRPFDRVDNGWTLTFLLRPGW
jgi:outer membrane protein assembly factor BamA